MNRYYVVRPSRSTNASWGGGEEEAVIEAAAASLIRHAEAHKVPNDTPLHDWREKDDKNEPLVPSKNERPPVSPDVLPFIPVATLANSDLQAVPSAPSEGDK